MSLSDAMINYHNDISKLKLNRVNIKNVIADTFEIIKEPINANKNIETR